jgi:thiol:disulfide interchange protein DsbD
MGKPSDYALLYILLCPLFALAQSDSPIKWSFNVDHADTNEAVITFSAAIPEGWHLYSQFLPPDGPYPTRFLYKTNDGYQKAGRTLENGSLATHYDEIYEMDIRWFTHHAEFSQRITKLQQDVMIEVMLEYMACNDQVCVPARKTFVITL